MRRRRLSAANWQIDYLFDLGFQGWLVHIGVVTLTGLILQSAFPGTIWPYLWMAAMLTLSAALAYLCLWHSRFASRSPGLTQRAGYAHTMLTTMVGLVWGAGALKASAGDFLTLAVYSLALGGTALGAVSSQHSLLRSCFASIWTAIPLLALAHAGHGPAADGAFIALMILLYGAILSILALRMSRFLTRNRELTETLRARLAELTETTRQLRLARESAEKANLSKSRFLAQASHDLRQPIHAIALVVETLKDTGLKRDQRGMLSSIERSIEAVTNLFGSLLDLSRLEIGGLEPRPQAIELSRFLREIHMQNASFAEAADCDFRMVDSRRWVRSDPNLLYTIVQNVLSNAFKYAPSSRVLIGVRMIGGKPALQICDTGPGIAEAQRERIFDEFYRADQGPAGGEGMGLGLSIVRRLEHLLGLDVTLRSEVGRGTSVTIAGLEAAAPMVRREVPGPGAHPLAGRRVALIEGDRDVRAATQRLLERWGCSVEAGDDPREIASGCEIIISDLHLPADIDGLEGIRQARQRLGRKVPALLVTGQHDRETEARCEEEGVSLLAKPIRPTQLRAVLTTLTGPVPAEQAAEEAAGAG